ncbi:MAG: hypothetical protein HXY18_03865 [Bryobacteraceae bacterium]|nr:hypothetical protein [Bryobacteraceae bacterium]
MKRSLFVHALAALLAAPLFAQMKVETAGAPPSEAAALAPALAREGVKVLKEDGSVLCEMWFVSALPSGAAAEESASFAGTPHGALLGVARFPNRHSDRRGQTIKPGVYTMRYSLFPLNGDHQGVAPQRDFILFSPAATDTDPAARPNFETLMDMSRKASGTPHPLVLSFWKDESGAAPGVEAAGDSDRVLHTRIGAVPAAIIIVGRHEG